MQSFPLVDEEVQIINEKPNEAFCYRIKPDWMEELEKLTPRDDTVEFQDNVNNVKDFPLSLEELKEKRKEMARLRVKESYRIDKARRMNKIKSKKYHKLMKREKIRAQLKEFEILQKTDPEAALKQLELIDKTRILERANLRHKNTGTWAKNLQIRAKYDKDVRIELAQQLAISRDLTQKHKLDESSEDEKHEHFDEVTLSNYDPLNPWISKKVENEISTFTSGYKKYWNERNVDKNKFKKMLNHASNLITTKQAIDKNEKNNCVNDERRTTLNSSNQSILNTSGIWDVEEESEEDKSKSKLKVKSIDDIFDSVEPRIEDAIKKKLSNLRKTVQNNKILLKKENINQFNEELLYKSGLEFPKVARRPDIDDELFESELHKPVNENNYTNSVEEIARANENNNDQIDPTKFIQAKPKYISMNIADMVEITDALDDDHNEDYNNEKQLTIAEAFEEDDIIADFIKEKENEINKDGGEEINRFLPGWGSWTGSGLVAMNLPTNKRFIVKMPKKLPRRDENRDHVIINETANAKMKSHLVSKLPFPFTSVKDYEASIRTPYGASFIPETASRILTKPAVETKLGTIIEPMDEKMLLRNKLNRDHKRKRCDMIRKKNVKQ